TTIIMDQDAPMSSPQPLPPPPGQSTDPPSPAPPPSLGDTQGTGNVDPDLASRQESTYAGSTTLLEPTSSRLAERVSTHPHTDRVLPLTPHRPTRRKPGKNARQKESPRAPRLGTFTLVYAPGAFCHPIA
ncbi:hypothetical protein H0H93_015691, partial [Arthromyces matolae]